MALPEEVAPITTFSKMTSLGDLREVFGRKVRLNRTRRLEMVKEYHPIQELLGDDTDSLQQLYTSLFDSGEDLPKTSLPSTIPAFLQPVLTHMVFCHNNNEHLFHNGAGKLWLCRLFDIRHHVDIGTDWGVKVSTTTNSVSDWCGIRGRNISGS